MRWPALAGLLLLGACDGATQDPVITPTKFDPATLRAVKGVVRYAGAVPAPKRLAIGGHPECSALHAEPPHEQSLLVSGGCVANAFVYVKEGAEKHVFDWPRTPVVVKNERCIYAPRVAGAQVHQPIRFTNEDSADHNVHGFTATQGDFNFTLRGRGAIRDIKLRKPDVVMTVKCDIHPWMIGYVGVLPHPFFATTGPDGAFELRGLPPGEYLLEAWHETLGRVTAKVTVASTDLQGVDLPFPVK